MTNKFKKDENKLLIALSYAFNTTIDTLTVEEIEKHHITYKNNTFFIEQILHRYYTIIELYQKRLAKSITIFDKALCLGMALKKNPTFDVINKENVPQNIKNVNEQYCIQAMLTILSHSTYSLTGNEEAIPLNLKTIDREQQDKIEALQQELITILKSEEYQSEQVLSILNKIYLTAVAYSYGLESDFDEEKLRKNLKIKESKSAVHLSYKKSDIPKKLKEIRDKKFVH